MAHEKKGMTYGVPYEKQIHKGKPPHIKETKKKKEKSGGFKEGAEKGAKTLKKILTGDSKKKSGGDPHGRTAKEKVKDVITGTGLSSKAKKVRDFAIGGAILATGTLGSLASRAANIVKKAHARKKE